MVEQTTVMQLKEQLTRDAQDSNSMQDTMRLEHMISRLEVTSRDCKTLMPDGQPDQQARNKGLRGEMQVLEEELVETEARHRLYQLLAERTR